MTNYDDSSDCEDGCEGCEGLGDWCDIADKYLYCKPCRCKQPHKIVWSEPAPHKQGDKWGMATKVFCECSVCYTEQALMEDFKPNTRQQSMFSEGGDG